MSNKSGCGEFNRQDIENKDRELARMREIAAEENAADKLESQKEQMIMYLKIMKTLT
jgi:hypothetical protein